jgi:hypothetical protein
VTAGFHKILIGIKQLLDDPKYVMIDLEFDDASKAEAFRIALRDLWRQAEEQKIMQNPRARIIEAVEAKEY